MRVIIFFLVLFQFSFAAIAAEENYEPIPSSGTGLIWGGIGAAGAGLGLIGLGIGMQSSLGNNMGSTVYYITGGTALATGGILVALGLQQKRKWREYIDREGKRSTQVVPFIDGKQVGLLTRIQF